MRALILCEGKADRILLSYYLEKVLGFCYTEEDVFISSASLLGKSNSSSIFNCDNHAPYVDVDDNRLMMADVHGCDFVPAIKEFLEWNRANRKYDCFQKVVVVTDNDDVSVEKRLKAAISELSDKSETEVNYRPNKWYSFGYSDGFGDVSTYDFLFLLQPRDGYGNIETFILDALRKRSDIDESVIENARKYIASLDVKNGVYLKERGDRNKAELSSYFSVVAPGRIFAPIDELLKSVEWGKYDDYNAQFALLKQLVKK